MTGKSNNSSPLRVLFNSGLYGATSILQGAVGFFLLPIYTAHLTPTDYGIIGVVTSFTAVVSLSVTLSLEAAVRRFYFDYRDSPSQLREFWGTVVIFVAGSSLLVGFALFLLRDVISGRLLDNVDFFPYIALGVFTVVVSPVYNMYQAMLKTMQQAARASILASIYFLVTIAITLVLVVAVGLGATGVLTASFLTALMFFVAAVYNMFHGNLIRLRFRPKLLRSALVYSVPLVPHLMSSAIAQFLARLLLNNYGSTAELGLYNVGAQFISLVTSIQMAVNTAFVPWFYGQMMQGKGGHASVVRLADYLLKANLVGSLFLALFSREIVGIMTAPEFAEAWKVIPVLVVAYQIWGIYVFHINTLFYNKRGSRFVFIASVFGSLFGIILNVVLVDDFGIMAPAWALVGQQCITAAIAVALSRRIEKVDFMLGKMVGYVFLLAAMSFVGLACEYLHLDTGACNASGAVARGVMFAIFTGVFLAPEWGKIARVAVTRLSSL